MSDIWTAIVVMSCVSAVTALLAARYLQGAKDQRVMLLLALSIVAAVFFQLYLAGQLTWARIVPSSAAIIYSNLAAVFAGWSAGCAWRLPNMPAWRRVFLALSLGIASLAAVLWPLIASLGHTRTTTSTSRQRGNESL